MQRFLLKKVKRSKQTRQAPNLDSGPVFWQGQVWNDRSQKPKKNYGRHPLAGWLVILAVGRPNNWSVGWSQCILLDLHSLDFRNPLSPPNLAENLAAAGIWRRWPANAARFSTSTRLEWLIFLHLAYDGCARACKGVRQAWRRWLSVFQLNVLKLACEVAEWVLRYSSDH